MRQQRDLTTVGFVALACILSTPRASSQAPWTEVESAITSASLEGAIRFLASDALEGRGVASRGDELTRLYLATSLQSMGLRPGGEDGGYEQAVPVVGMTTTTRGAVRAVGPRGGVTFATPDDVVLQAGKPDASLATLDVPVVFVGYGIDAPEERWNDFKDVDVRGKLLLVMNNDPESDPKRFAGRTRLYYGRWSYKYEEAARRGAVGALVIHTTPSAGYPFHVIQAGHGREAFHLPFGDEPTLTWNAWCSESAAKSLVALGGFDLDTLRAAAETDDFRPVELGVKFSASADNTVRQIRSANVLAVLPGSDPVLRDQVVVVTAHFDHLGIGPERKGDTIYNGALDNASGVAAMLALARSVTRLSTAPRRTILFASVTAEESGLLGSAYYARHPTYPRERLVANYNIDGINIWGAAKDIALVGHGKSSLTALAEEVASARGRHLLPDPEVDKGLFYRSDHFSFARIGVPSAYFKSGVEFLDAAESRQKIQRTYTATYYHTPQDEFGKGWDLSGAVDDTRLILECLLRTANADEVPTWTPGDEFEKHR